MKLRLLSLAIGFLFLGHVNANVYTVTNTAGNGWWPACGDPGSFQEALCNATANPGRDTIVFNLPGGTVVSAAKNPFTIGPADSDLFINGFSTQDGNAITFDFSITVTGTDITFNGLDFQTVNHALTITGNNNEVDSCSFAVTGGGQNSLWINGGTGTVVTNSTFTASPLHAISVENGGSHTIDGCTVTGITDVGIIVRGTGGNTIKNCTVSNGAHNGIGLLSSNNLIDSNVVFSNARAGIVGDNSLGTCSDNTVSNNEIYGNNTNYWMNAGVPTPDQGGIQFNGPNTTIYNNWVYNNGGNGILVNTAAATNAVIRKNIVGRDKLGNELGNQWNGIFVWEANGAVTDSNVIVNNGAGASHGTYSMPDRVSGIRYQEVSSGTINDNFIGTDALKAVAGNDFDGITLHTNVTGMDVYNNVICYNGLASTYGDGGGLALRNNSGSVNIYSNFIGAHPDLTDGGNNEYGISLEGAGNNVVGGNTSAEANVIANSKNTFSLGNSRGCGIWMVLAATTNNTITNNVIMGNEGAGIEIERDASNNIIGEVNEANAITGNMYGVLVHTNAALDNTLRYNSFSCNTEKGISLQNGGNAEYGNTPAPKGVYVSSNEPRANFVSGYAPSASAIVDIYVADTNCPLDCDSAASQGMTMVATVTAAATASPNGLFAWEYDFVAGGNLVNKNNVIVLATEAGVAGQTNTSEFSICYLDCNAPSNVTINSSDFDICEGESTTLTANSSSLSASASYSYNWYLSEINPDSLVHYAVDDSIFTVSNAGSYLVVVADLTDTTTCVDTSAVVNVDVNPLPTISLTPSSATLCSGSTVDITSSVSAGTMSYTWKPNGETTSDITVNSGGTYELVVENTTTGCKDSTSTTITEYQTPNQTNISANDSNLCTGESADLIAHAIGLSDTNDYVYNWYLTSISNGNLVHTATNDSTYSSGTAGDYFVVISNVASGNQCADSSFGVPITVTALPTITITPDSNSFCAGDTINVAVSATGTNLSYAWQPNGETDTIISVSAAGTYTVTVTDTVANCSDNSSVSLSVDALPAPSASAPFFCQGDETTVSAGISGMIYSWLPSGNSTQSFTVSAPGTHYLVVTDPLTGCDNYDTAIAEMSPEPKPDLTLPVDTALCPTEGDEVDLTATVISNVNGTLTWSTGDVDVYTITARDTITYSAVFVDTYGCSDSDSVAVAGNCVPPDPHGPNIVTTESPWTPIGDISPEQFLKSNLRVYNRWGLLVFETEEILPIWKGKNTRGIPVSAGVYYWVWEFTDNTETEKFYNGFVQVVE